MPIDNGFVGMVDRDVFDAWLRDRAAANGAERRTGTFKEITWDPDGVAVVHFRPKGDDKLIPAERVRARVVVGADGAKSSVAAQCIKGAERSPACIRVSRNRSRARKRVSTAHAATFIIRVACRPTFTAGYFRMATPPALAADPCARGFPCASPSTALREAAGLADAETIRREGAPIPLRPMRRWDNGRDVIVAGDAAGVVAPASGEGIYYAMECGRLAAEAVTEFCATGNVRALRTARRRFMQTHGRVFLDTAHDAVVLVFQRQAAGAVCEHLPRSGRAAANLGFLHEQTPDPNQPDGPCQDLFQGRRTSSWFGAGVNPEIILPVLWGVLVAGIGCMADGAVALVPGAEEAVLAAA